MDLISNLPKHILHEILFRMPANDAARTSILSKTWKETCSTSPILVFVVPRNATKKYAYQRDPHQMQVLIRERNYFLNHVGSTLQRFHDQGLSIRHFRLHLDFCDPWSLAPLIDHWIELATVNGVKLLALDLDFVIPYIYLLPNKRYCLPLNILESKSLVWLILCGSLRVDEAFLNHSIEFCSLQVLSLSYVYVGEEQIIQNLISSCPLIRYMELIYCVGLKFVSIHNLPKLKTVDFRGLEGVAVDTPSLECFHFTAGFGNTPCKTNVDMCRNLRNICLSFLKGTVITNQWLIELLHKFPLLEKLELKDCTVSNRMHISTMQLKVLKFTRCDELKEAYIDAPNLHSCSYHGCRCALPSNVSFSNNSSSLQFNVMFDICLEGDFLRLRNFLQNIKPTNVRVSLALNFVFPVAEFDPYVILQGLSVPLPCIKHLQLQHSSDIETSCLPLLIGSLWCCRPVIISIKLNSTLGSRRLVKLLCEMLMGILKEDDCYCNSTHTKCWWHGLKDVEVTSSFTKDENVVTDCKTLLDALPHLSSEEEISFRLES